MEAATLPRQGMSEFAYSMYQSKYAMEKEDGTREEWPETAHRVTTNVLGALGYDSDSDEVQKVEALIRERKFLPGGRYLYASGRPLHQTQNCVLLKAEDSREGWADLLWKSAHSLMTGAGIGVDYSAVREEGAPIKKTGGLATGPLALMQMVNECGRGIMQGGNRRSAIWAGLNWQHPDIFKFIEVKDWSEEIKARKEADFNAPAPMDMTNVSVLLDDDFFEAIHNDDHPLHSRANAVYTITLHHMLKHAEPGFSVDVGDNAGETLRNACTEVTSRDDSDICNLGSLNMARFDDIEEFTEAVKYGTLFLLAGTVYSHVPYPGIEVVRSQNRRLGLGIMGVHEWLLQRGYRYEPTEELGRWLDRYAKSGVFADQWAATHEVSPPLATRAIAPTGTIGIVGETTTGIEPVFCVAYKRRYLSEGTTWKYQYVIDPTARRLIHSGVPAESIEDAYVLSYDVERRIAFQAWVQGWVDHGISSTINLPYPITDSRERADFGRTLLQYLPSLRGITVYPDGARGGQPLSIATYETAIESEGVVFEESEERCVGGTCGV